MQTGRKAADELLLRIVREMERVRVKIQNISVAYDLLPLPKSPNFFGGSRSHGFDTVSDTAIQREAMQKQMEPLRQEYLSLQDTFEAYIGVCSMEQARLLRFYYLDRLEVPQIAEKMQISESTLYAWLGAARDRIYTAQKAKTERRKGIEK